MSGPVNPGPPLLIEPEYCACDLPTRSEYIRAGFSAILAVALGAVALIVSTLATYRLWGVVIVIGGIVNGFLVYWAAGRHRSLATGLMAVGATLLGPLIGYVLLWLPTVSPEVDRALTWSHLVLTVVGCFVAYLLSGQKPGQQAR